MERPAIDSEIDHQTDSSPGQDKAASPERRPQQQTHLNTRTATAASSTALAEETPFLSHLVELRSRLLRAVAAIVLVFLCLMPVAKQLYALMAAPMLSQLPEGTKMLAIDVTSPFFVQMKLAFVVAVMIAVLPLPGLGLRRAGPVPQRAATGETAAGLPATLLFYTGCAFAYFLVLPTVIHFIGMIMPEGVDQATDISKYLDFVLALFPRFRHLL